MDSKTCLNQFLLAYQFRCTSGTLEIYECAIKQLLQFTGKSFDAITKQDIRKWLSYLSLEKGYKPSTLNNKISGLKNFFRYCKDEGLLSENVAKDINFTYEPDKLPRYLSPEQLIKLRSLVEGQPLQRAILEVLYSTGVRVSELVAMNKEDVNWNERSIIIRNGKYDEGRIVLFTSACAEYLKEYLSTRTDDLPNLFLIYNSEGTTSNSAKILEEWFRYYSNCLGIKVAPHTMRHTFAAHLAQKGMPFDCIQVLMGHDRPQTTRIYAKLFDKARKEKYEEWM